MKAKANSNEFELGFAELQTNQKSFGLEWKSLLLTHTISIMDISRPLLIAVIQGLKTRKDLS